MKLPMIGQLATRPVEVEKSALNTGKKMPIDISQPYQDVFFGSSTEKQEDDFPDEPTPRYFEPTFTLNIKLGEQKKDIEMKNALPIIETLGSSRVNVSMSSYLPQVTDVKRHLKRVMSGPAKFYQPNKALQSAYETLVRLSEYPKQREDAIEPVPHFVALEKAWDDAKKKVQMVETLENKLTKDPLQFYSMAYLLKSNQRFLLSDYNLPEAIYKESGTNDRKSYRSTMSVHMSHSDYTPWGLQSYDDNKAALLNELIVEHGVTQKASDITTMDQLEASYKLNTELMNQWKFDLLKAACQLAKATEDIHYTKEGLN